MELTDEQLQHLIEGIIASMVCLVEADQMIAGREEDWLQRAIELFGRDVVLCRPAPEDLQ